MYERCAEFSTTAATVLDHEKGQFSKSVEISAIDDRTAPTFALHKSGTRQYRQMRRHRILRHIQHARQFTSRNTRRFVLHQQTECIQSCRLGQSSESGYCFFIFHISRIMDIKGLSIGKAVSTHCRQLVKLSKLTEVCITSRPSGSGLVAAVRKHFKICAFAQNLETHTEFRIETVLFGTGCELTVIGEAEGGVLGQLEIKSCFNESGIFGDWQA